MRRFAVLWMLFAAGCGPASATRSGVPYAGSYALALPQLTADGCQGGCDANAYWSQAPTWTVTNEGSAYGVETHLGHADADAAGDALNFAMETPVVTELCSGDAVYVVTFAPSTAGCDLNLQTRFAVRCGGTMRVCDCSYTTTGDRTR